MQNKTVISQQLLLNEPRHEISNNLTSVDLDEPLQSPFKL